MRFVDKAHSKQDRHLAYFRAVREWAPEVEHEVRSLIPLWQHSLRSADSGLRLEIFQRVIEPENFIVCSDESLFQSLAPWQRCEVEADFPENALTILFRKQFWDHAVRFGFTTSYSRTILYMFFEYQDLYAELDVQSQKDVYLGEYIVFVDRPFVGDLLKFELGGWEIGFESSSEFARRAVADFKSYLVSYIASVTERAKAEGNKDIRGSWFKGKNVDPLKYLVRWNVQSWTDNQILREMSADSDSGSVNREDWVQFRKRCEVLGLPVRRAEIKAG